LMQRPKSMVSSAKCLKVSKSRYNVVSVY
jgi:hypothetical protein